MLTTKKEIKSIKTKLILKFGIPKFNNDGLLKSWSWKLSENEIEKGFKKAKINNNNVNNVYIGRKPSNFFN